ncbi:MAG: Zn-dependent hydrolase [Microbacteriaceae bacterium]
MDFDLDRMMQRLTQLATFGQSDDGAQQRIPYSPADQEVRDLFAHWAVASGLEVSVDAVGNVSAKLAGSESDLPAVMVGSHLDTQPDGGKYDGIAGTLAALGAVEGIIAAGHRPRRTIEVVCWAAEEGSGRFDIGCIGSKAMVGALRPIDLDLVCRMTGQTLREAMASCGLDPDGFASSERSPGSLHAVLEMHIEQGPYLAEAGIRLGVVSAISGNRRLPFRVSGVQAHSGAQPMSRRRDALCAAAELILAAESRADSTSGAVVATSGMFDHAPRTVAAVPGRADLVIDVRSADLDALQEAAREITGDAQTIARARGVAIEQGSVWGVDPTDTDPTLSALLERACEAQDQPHLRMVSGAGHDSMILGKRFPAGLLFVPSRDGISHSPEEFTTADDLGIGGRTLQTALVEIAA